MHEPRGQPSYNPFGQPLELPQELEFASDQLDDWLMQLPLDNIITYTNDENLFLLDLMQQPGSTESQMEGESAKIKEDRNPMALVEASSIDFPSTTPQLACVDDPLPNEPEVHEGVSQADHTVRKTRQRIDPDKWEKNRIRITSIYQDSTLSETRKIMETEYGFTASYVSIAWILSEMS